MKISEQFPTRFISAADLDKVKDGTKFTVKEIKLEDCIHPRTRLTEKKTVVYFNEAEKGHRLRKSEHKKLVEAFGDDAAGWTGKAVTLTRVSTQVGAGVRMLAK
jgi:hypothetical protein